MKTYDKVFLLTMMNYQNKNNQQIIKIWTLNKVKVKKSFKITNKTNLIYNWKRKKWKLLKIISKKKMIKLKILFMKI